MKLKQTGSVYTALNQSESKKAARARLLESEKERLAAAREAEPARQVNSVKREKKSE